MARDPFLSSAATKGEPNGAGSASKFWKEQQFDWQSWKMEEGPAMNIQWNINLSRKRSSASRTISFAAEY